MNRVLEQVQSGDFDPKKMFTGNKDEFLEVKTAIESISNNLPKEVCINFILTKIIPTIFDKSVDNTIRDEAVEIGLHVLQSVNVSALSTKEQENVFTSIETTYTKVIGELRDSNYANWDKLWIFLIKLCTEKLHTKMSLANKLLRVVEVAFRNSISIEQRLKAYDCWIELINNSSLNMEHMCSAKQIKLLVTPMKAKFSRMPVVIMKRCDTFVYLLEKLGDKATLCLKEFLEFCFGPFDEKNDVEKMRQGRSVPEVCSKSTKVLLEIIGHSHNSSEECLNSDGLKLYKPLISDVNFQNFADILIKSVIECCILLNEWSQDLPKNNTIIKCLWRSLLQLVHDSNSDVKKKCSSHISSSLRTLLERSKYNESLHSVLGNIIDILIQDEMVETFKDVIFDISMHLLYHIDIDSCSFDTENLRNFTISCFDAESGSKFDKIASNSFKNFKKCENPILSEIWLKCKITVVPENVSNFIWPLRHLEKFKDTEALKSKWSKLYTSECKTENMKAIIIQEIEKLFLENPLLSSNIVVFLELIASSGDSTKDFVARFMRLVELVLTLPNLPQNDVRKLSGIVLSYCNQNHLFYKSESNDEAFDKLCACLEHLVTIHKDYTILTELTTHLKNSQPKNLTKFSKRLMSFLETLMLSEDNSVANSTRKLIELLETKENEPDTTSLTLNRSLKIVNMANVAKSKRLSDQANNLRLFGRDIDKSSPLSLKTKTFSSPRGKSRVIDNKKNKNPIVLLEDKSSDYVKVDTEVKINIDNLNEHQLEMLKRRREDIPAMYTDLTQSQSQDFFKTVEDKTEDVPDESVSSKKRKREDDDFEVVNKAPKMIDPGSGEGKISDEGTEGSKISENRQEAETETLDLDNDLPEIFNDEDAIPKIRTEDLNNMNIFEDETPSGFVEKVEHTVNKVEEAQTGDIVSQNNVEDKNVSSEETEELNIETETSPEKLHKSSTPEKLHKSKRHSSSKQFREDIANVVKKQLDESREKDETGNTSLDEHQNNTTLDEHQNKIETSTLNDTYEEAKPREEQETSVRKSKRQVKQRHSDYALFFGNKRRSRGQDAAQNLSQDDFTPKSEEVKERKKDPNNSLRKVKKHKRQSDDEESMESLLARVDARIEMKKREQQKLETQKNEDWSEDLQDGNQNKISPSMKKLEDTQANRPSTPEKTKRVITPEPHVETIESKNVAEDVYEFKGDEEATPGEIKKPKPKKKKSRNIVSSFNRSDYISKRRKRASKKETKGEGFQFHVTADSVLPLSESPSLRAVPSHESETITIVITRSPPDPLKENKETDNSVDTTPTSPKTKSKRKTSPNSENIIESSQVSPPADTSKRRLRSRPKRDETELKTEVADVKETTFPPKLLKIRRLSLTEPTPQAIEVGTRLTRSQSLDKLNFDGKITFADPRTHVNDTSSDTLTCESSTPDAIQASPVETDVDDIQQLDTLTLSPIKTKDDLPGSPVTCETPNRTLELLNSTSDISPISSAPEVSTPIPKHVGNEVSNMRVARLLQMANSNVQISNEGRRWLGSKHSSPSGSKVRKMRLKKDENLDILTFSREVPSPLTVPTSGILKRKLSSLEDTATPSPKRKRVNFSDPAISERKIFIKDSDEYDIDQNTDGANPQDDEDDGENAVGEKKGFLSACHKENLVFNLKDFCDSSSKEAHKNQIRNALRHLLQKLKIPEVVDVICEYLNSVDFEHNDESGSQVFDHLVVPLVEKVSFEEFLPKLLEVVQKLPEDKCQLFIDEVSKAFGETIRGEDISEKQIEDRVVNLDCDKMSDLVKRYISNLDSEKRNGFLVELMNLASSELPVNKEFVNCHVNILQDFVRKMTD